MFVDIQPIFSFIIALFRNISTQFQYSIEHIAPLRNAPSRLYIADSSYTTVGNSGENAIQLLNEISAEEIFAVKAPHDDILKKDVSRYTIRDVINDWLIIGHIPARQIKLSFID